MYPKASTILSILSLPPRGKGKKQDSPSNLGLLPLSVSTKQGADPVLKILWGTAVWYIDQHGNISDQVI